MRYAFAALIAATLLTGAGLEGQNLFALPGPTSNSNTVLVYVADPFLSVTNFMSGVGSFQVVGKPDGSKFYVFSSTTTNSLTSVDSTFQNPKFIGNFSQKPTAIVALPDGRHIAVADGGLQIVDTSTDTIATVPNVNAFDIAVSLDGSRIYALNESAAGAILYAVDPNSGIVLASLNIASSATGVAVAPNGLVYVSCQGQLIEINPVTLVATTGGTIPVNGRPGKAAFTPDGQRAVTVNLTPNTGTAALLFDLPSHSIKNSIANFLVTLNSLLVASNSTVFAYSTQTDSLYQITISANNGFQINPLTISGLNNSAVNAAVLSNEVAAPGVAGAKYLFVASAGGTIYRVNLALNKVDAQVVPASPAGALSWVSPAVTNSAVATLLPYGGGQTVAPSATSMPIVARALDGSGRPIQGVSVAFTTDNASAHVNPSSVLTGEDGYAVTFMTAPAATGTVHVTAESGTKSANYTITVAAASGGTGAGPGGLAITAGQGQILFANFTTNFDNNSPFTVKLTDSNGNPVSNTKVTFTLASGGIGSFTGGTSTGTLNQSFVTTDSKGIAAINFAAGPLPQLSAFVQDVITAKAPNTNTVTFYLTVTTQAPSPIARVINENPGDVITGQAGTVVKGKFSVQVLAPMGAPIPNVSVRIQNALNPALAPAATCVDPTGVGILTDATGTANCDLMLGGSVGSNNTISANVGYQLNTFSVQVHITPGPPGLVTKLAGDNQSGKPGTRLQSALVVQISDGVGNVLSGVKVTFTPSAGVTVNQASTVTDVNGKASTIVTLGNTLGPQTITVTAGTVSAVFNETVVTAATNIQKTGGDLQRTIINTAFPNPLVVQVTDILNNPVSGVPVTFALASGSATLSALNAITDLNGNASITVAAGATAGPVIITASVNGTNLSTTFNLSANMIVATAIRIVSGNSQTALVNTAFANPLVVNVSDSNGNPVSGVAVTFAVINAVAHPATISSLSAPAAAATATIGTPIALTDANGNASTTVTAGPDPGTITITATTPNVAAVTFTLTAIQPGFAIKSVVNGASLQKGISPGSVATIIGTGLPPGIQGVVTAGTIVGPLLTSLAGVSVQIGGIDAPLYSVSNVNGQEQITFQVPFELPLGTTPLTVNIPNGSPTTTQVVVQKYSPGIFEYAEPGHFAVLIRPDGTYVGPDNPTHPGETVIMFTTGLGQTNPVIGTNQAGAPGQDVVTKIIMGIGSKGFAPDSVTTYAGVVGVYEVTFTIPADAATGAKQPLGLGVKASPTAKPIYAQTVFAPIE